MPDAVLNVCVTALARRVALNYLEVLHCKTYNIRSEEEQES